MPTLTDPTQALQQIRSDIAPHLIYILAGEEEYYIDKIEKKLVDTYVDPETRDFNFRQYYGAETSAEEVIASVRRFPMMGQHNVVVVREAQGLLQLEALQNLVSFPVPSSILILSFKGKMPDGRSAFVKTVKEKYLFVESRKIYENHLPTHIAHISKEHGVSISLAASQLLAENVGSDLQRIEKEIEKLRLAPQSSSRTLIEEDIRRYTSVSKVYNNFELLKALSTRNFGQSMKIVDNLSAEQKKVPIQLTLSTLFSYFTLLLQASLCANKSEQGLMKALELKARFQVFNYSNGVKNYSPRKIRQIIAYLRKCDARSKGMYGGDADAKAILFDLVYFILN